ncbi:hypothetical protein AM493_01450 [Flavobacterium akiainvivens]|uniref:Cyclic nucleotide-binding domain-containing protein n=1 Tax=Flavobacterium akiainvivens TaxID=1202724 RepID=A0A0M8MDV1_9FLAO|nr:hypothetical protein AM493_01450 [Flavobacterium akiainvivens]
MYEPLYDYIETKSGSNLTPEEKLHIQLFFKPKHLRKRQYLLQEGDICKDMSFIVKGAGRMFGLNDKGQEYTMRFGIENWWLGDYESYNYSIPSRHNIEMVEDSDLLQISKEGLQKLTSLVPAFDAMIKEIDKKGVVANQKRIYSSISLNAEEKYDAFLKSYPKILNRFPLVMIASYLGISPETLSRIRKNILNK